MTYFTGIVDFGATDAPMTDAQLASSTKGHILHIPVTIGAVAISYNLSGVSGHLNLTGPIIANIYLGTVKYWDDASITAINAGVSLPHQTIAVVHRSDGSGTTGIFTHYLSAISPDWMSKVGAGTTVNWPTGVGAKGNSGVAAQVKSTTGAIGYNELGYVLTNSIQYAAVQNANMKYVVPSVDSAAAAAQNIDMRHPFLPICASTLSTRLAMPPTPSPVSPGRSCTRIRRIRTKEWPLQTCSGGLSMMASSTLRPSATSHCLQTLSR